MTFKNSKVFGYGDSIFKSEVANGNDLLGDIKDHIIDNYYSCDRSIEVVITSLNKL